MAHAHYRVNAELDAEGWWHFECPEIPGVAGKCREFSQIDPIARGLAAPIVGGPAEALIVDVVTP